MLLILLIIVVVLLFGGWGSYRYYGRPTGYGGVDILGLLVFLLVCFLVLRFLGVV